MARDKRFDWNPSKRDDALFLQRNLAVAATMSDRKQVDRSNFIMLSGRSIKFYPRYVHKIFATASLLS